MTRFLSVLVLVVATISNALPQQEPAHQKSSAISGIFSGVVTALAPDSVTVVRKVPAREDATQTFVRDSRTKVEGSLKVGARVAVRFRSVDEGPFIALTIVVR